MLKTKQIILVIVSLMFLLGGALPQDADARSAWHRRCQGSGALQCYHCHGTGVQQNGFDCHQCNGSGKHECGRCKGSGVLMSIVKVHKV